MIAPAASEAVSVTITSVSVTVGGTTWCSTNLACTNPIWDLGSGVNLSAFGNSLILTQTGGAAGYNFDTSEGNPGGCGIGAPACATSITINGVLIGGGNNLLANGNADPGGNNHNEAANYAAYGATPAVSVFTGYADNVHLDACADADHNCQPDPFANSATDHLIGEGTDAPTGFVETNPNHCSTTPGTNTCFNAGVIWIVNGAVGERRAVPEPSTLLLLAVGIMGLAAWGRSSPTRRHRTVAGALALGASVLLLSGDGATKDQ
jgi:hypothetical protein